MCNPGGRFPFRVLTRHQLRDAVSSGANSSPGVELLCDVSDRGGTASLVPRSLCAVRVSALRFSRPLPAHPVSKGCASVLELGPLLQSLTGPGCCPLSGSDSRGVWSPSAFQELEARFTRVCLARHLPTSGFPALLPVSFFQRRPAVFQAGSALGVFLQGLFPSQSLRPSRAR